MDQLVHCCKWPCNGTNVPPSSHAMELMAEAASSSVHAPESPGYAIETDKVAEDVVWGVRRL